MVLSTCQPQTRSGGGLQRSLAASNQRGHHRRVTHPFESRHPAVMRRSFTRRPPRPTTGACGSRRAVSSADVSAHPILGRVTVDEAACDDGTCHGPPLWRHSHGCPQQHSILHNALGLAAAQLQQAVERQPAQDECRPLSLPRLSELPFKATSDGSRERGTSAARALWSPRRSTLSSSNHAGCPPLTWNALGTDSSWFELLQLTWRPLSRQSG